MQVGFALMSRRQTFLSEPQWTTIPWSKHPKGSLDQLFDIILFLPSIFAWVDQLQLGPPTQDRRFRAQELLQNCLLLSKRFQQWHDSTVQVVLGDSVPIWTRPVDSSRESLPFTDAFVFRDVQTGLAMVYYWMSQILFQGCIDSLTALTLEPFVDEYPSVWNMPPGLRSELASCRQDSRTLASNLCRGLDSILLQTAQPDMLSAPMTVALDYFHGLSANNADGLLEVVWLESFRERLVGKGQQVTNLMKGRAWWPVASF